MENKLDIADRLAAIADEMKGFSGILFLIYENEVNEGSEGTADALLTLSKMAERYCKDLGKMITEI